MTATAPPSRAPLHSSSPPVRRIRGPRWLDGRLILGVALVLGAVLLGAKVISSADATTPMWAASRDLSAGAVLADDDLTTVRVRLPTADTRYVPAGTDVRGRTLSRAIGAGELVPATALTTTAASTAVTVPIPAMNAPTITRGQRIKLWVTTKSCNAVPILDDVTVQAVNANTGGAFTSGATQGVVVRIPADLAQRVVTALALDGAVIRAGVLDGAASPGANTALPPLERCSGTR